MSSKYPRTFHLPWSEGATNDDKIAKSVDSLLGVQIVITEKLDGENSCLEKDGIFARTHAHAPKHPSFDHLKSLHATVAKSRIPEGVQCFGENVAAKHSIAYDALPGYFLLFGVRVQEIDHGQWIDWYNVENMADNLGVPTVPVLFTGIIKSEKELMALTKTLMTNKSKCGGELEGLVIRVEREFTDDEFSNCVMKMVRKNHVQTNKHWKYQKMIQNKLAAK